MFLETSALTGENVEEAFLQCSKIILSKIETGNKEFCLFIAIKMLMNERNFSGELDPNKLGSGIQHGDSALKRIQRQAPPPAMSPPSCSGCKI